MDKFKNNKYDYIYPKTFLIQNTIVFKNSFKYRKKLKE